MLDGLLVVVHGLVAVLGPERAFGLGLADEEVKFGVLLRNITHYYFNSGTTLIYEPPRGNQIRF